MISVAAIVLEQVHNLSPKTKGVIAVTLTMPHAIMCFYSFIRY